MQKFLRRLERFSQSLLSPLSYLSAAGLLLVLGALLTSKPLCQALAVALGLGFCFVSPLLWVAHAVITGGFMVLLHVLHVRAFTSNLLGSLVFNLSAGEQPFPQTSPRTPTRRRCAGSSPRWAGRRTSPSWETASPASGSRCGMPRCWIWGLCSPCPIKVLWCRAPGSSWSAACTPPSSAMRLNSSLPRWPRCDCILIRETV